MTTIRNRAFIVLLLPVLISAGCNAHPIAQPMRERTTQASQTDVNPQHPEPAGQAWKVITNNKLNYSLSYPSSWKVGLWGPAHSDPTDDEPSIINPQYPGQPVYVELSAYNCPSTAARECLEDYLKNYQTTDKSWRADATQIKVLTTSTGLIGAFYDIQDKAMPSKVVIFIYPDNLRPNTQVAIHMRSYQGPILDDQSSTFLRIAESFQFTR